MRISMERYLSLRRQKDGKIPTVRIAPDAGQEPLAKKSNADVHGGTYIPASMRSRATLLLKRLKARPDVVSRDESGHAS